MVNRRSDRTASGLNYSVQGSGPPMLWLSGYVVAASALEATVAAFSDRYTCITFDPRGSGESRQSLTPLSTSRMARDAIDVLETAGFESAHVIGFSLGGMVAQEVALRTPQHVRGLILVATSAGGAAAHPTSVWTMLSALSTAPERVPGARNARLRTGWAQGWAAMTHDATSRLGELEAPALILHGSRDILLPVANSEELARLIPNSRLQVLRGAGHLFPYEEVDTMATAVHTWLEGQGEISAGEPLGPPGCSDKASGVIGAPARAARLYASIARNLARSVTSRP